MANKIILQIGKYYPPNEGGIEKVSELISRAIFKSSTNYFIGFNSNKSTKVRRGVYGEVIIEFGLDIKLASQPISLTLLFYLNKLIKRISPTLIIFHHPNPILSFFDKKYQYLIWNHGKINVNRGLYKLYINYEKKLFSKSKAVFHSTPTIIRSDNHNNIISPFCIDETLFLESKKPKIPLKKFLFTYCRHVKYKGLDVLIEAFKKSEYSGSLVIGGIGPETNYLKGIAKNHNILFLGKIPYSEITWLLKNADCFMFSSTNNSETFGFTLLEAMYNGCPIVKFEIKDSGANWVCPSEVCINSGPPGIENLTESINKIIKTPRVELNKIGQSGKSRYSNFFSNDSVIKSLNRKINEFI